MRCRFFVVPIVLMPLMGCGRQTSEEPELDSVAQRSLQGASNQPDRPAETEATQETADVADADQPADAEAILSASLARAQQEDKRLLVHLGAPG